MTGRNHNGIDIADKTVLITGANRGIGRALVNEALRRGAKRVFAGSRGPIDIADDRVTSLTLDVTNASQIQRAVEAVDTLDVLINNAGVAIYDDLSNLDIVEQHLQFCVSWREESIEQRPSGIAPESGLTWQRLRAKGSVPGRKRTSVHPARRVSCLKAFAT